MPAHTHHIPTRGRYHSPATGCRYHCHTPPAAAAPATANPKFQSPQYAPVSAAKQPPYQRALLHTPARPQLFWLKTPVAADHYHRQTAAQQFQLHHASTHENLFSHAAAQTPAKTLTTAPTVPHPTSATPLPVHLRDHTSCSVRQTPLRPGTLFPHPPPVPNVSSLARWPKPKRRWQTDRVCRHAPFSHPAITDADDG